MKKNIYFFIIGLILFVSLVLFFLISGSKDNSYVTVCENGEKCTNYYN